jgi:hypothetical protein
MVKLRTVLLVVACLGLSACAVDADYGYGPGYYGYSDYYDGPYYGGFVGGYYGGYGGGFHRHHGFDRGHLSHGGRGVARSGHGGGWRDGGRR